MAAAAAATSVASDRASSRNAAPVNHGRTDRRVNAASISVEQALRVAVGVEPLLSALEQSRHEGAHARDEFVDVGGDELSAAHDDVAGDHRHVHVRPADGVHQVVVDVGVTAGGEERRHARGVGPHRDEVGPFYRLVEITYALDGVQLVHRRDESGALARHRVEVHDGLLRPGDHTLSVVLRYVGEGGELISYLRGYRFAVRSSHAFMAPPGRHVRLEVRAFTRGPDVPYEDRLGVSFRASIEELR